MTIFMDQYQALLAQLISVPNSPVDNHSLVIAESSLLPDPKALLETPLYPPVMETFAVCSAKYPQKTAICHGASSWSYQHLAQSAEKIAQALTHKGLAAQNVVAVTGVRSFGLIASILGVLQTRGILLLIDPELPLSRQHTMLEEAQAKYLLHIPTEPTAIPYENMQEAFMQVDATSGNILSSFESATIENASVTVVKPTSNDPAYIFFTSGSTGIPKGILGSHKALSHFMQWQRETFTIDTKDQGAFLTGLSFDMVLRDLFLPLTSGATLHIPITIQMEGHEVLEWLNKCCITFLHLVPSRAHNWLHSMKQKMEFPSLRWLFFAGEPLRDSLVKMWRSTFPNTGEIVNFYGATETTLIKCYHLVAEPPTPGVQPAGLPLPQTQMLVLKKNRVCDIGEIGEIVIRTPFCSFGYINAPEEQQRRFVANPFRHDPADLFYYTGDQGRYLPDGSLEVLGRLDHQVKINGIRIELGEVEAMLQQHPQISANVVVLYEEKPEQKMLICYFVAKNPIAENELRNFLKTRLPHYLIPAQFISLEKLPLNASGKVNRQALPTPTKQRQETYVPPRNDTEKQLATIVGELLHLDKVGIYDNFFGLGGHSLLVIQFISRIHKAFAVQLTINTIFEFPCIAEIAVLIIEKTVSEAENEDMERMLAELEGLSPEEVEQMLKEEEEND